MIDVESVRHLDLHCGEKSREFFGYYRIVKDQCKKEKNRLKSIFSVKTILS